MTEAERLAALNRMLVEALEKMAAKLAPPGSQRVRECAALARAALAAARGQP